MSQRRRLTAETIVDAGKGRTALQAADLSARILTASATDRELAAVGTILARYVPATELQKIHRLASVIATETERPTSIPDDPDALPGVDQEGVLDQEALTKLIVTPSNRGVLQTALSEADGNKSTISPRASKGKGRRKADEDDKPKLFDEGDDGELEEVEGDDPEEDDLEDLDAEGDDDEDGKLSDVTGAGDDEEFDDEEGDDADEDDEEAEDKDPELEDEFDLEDDNSALKSPTGAADDDLFGDEFDDEGADGDLDGAMDIDMDKGPGLDSFMGGMGAGDDSETGTKGKGQKAPDIEGYYGDYPIDDTGRFNTNKQQRMVDGLGLDANTLGVTAGKKGKGRKAGKQKPGFRPSRTRVASSAEPLNEFDTMFLDGNGIGDVGTEFDH